MISLYVRSRTGDPGQRHAPEAIVDAQHHFVDPAQVLDAERAVWGERGGERGPVGYRFRRVRGICWCSQSTHLHVEASVSLVLSSRKAARRAGHCRRASRPVAGVSSCWGSDGWGCVRTMASGVAA
jgi:hypothetical protein